MDWASDHWAKRAVTWFNSRRPRPGSRGQPSHSVRRYRMGLIAKLNRTGNQPCKQVARTAEAPIRVATVRDKDQALKPKIAEKP